MEQRIVYHFVWGPMRQKPCLTGEAARRLLDLIRQKADELQLSLEDVAYGQLLDAARRAARLTEAAMGLAEAVP